MRKGNGRPEVDNVGLDLEHELPASNDSSENTGSSAAQPSAPTSELQKLQAEILERYTQICKPGGLVVYATCSIARAENSDQVQSFLKRHPEFLLEYELSLPPQTRGGDGFYAARMKRLS